MMKFSQYWEALMKKKNNPSDDQVLTISIANLKKMQKQAWELGEKHGIENSKSMANDFSSIFGDAFKS